MRVIDGVKEVISFASEIVLSCGPSQIYGLIKGAVDLYKYSQIQKKILTFQAICAVHKTDYYDKLVLEKKITKIEVENQCDYAENHLFSLEQKRERIIQSLKKDFISLIPIIGALFAWRIGAPENEKSLWKHTPFITHAIGHAFQDCDRVARSAMFPFVGNEREDVERVTEGRLKINVPIGGRKQGGRELDAIFLRGKDVDAKGPTVVLTHGNAMICHEFANYAYAHWYQLRGFNVLMVTMGGYADSPGVFTSEKTTYQDVEAIKKYLDNRGIKHVGFHGLSIGGTMAFQGAVGKTESKVKTMFVVADQTLTSAREVYANVVPKIISAIAEGVAIAGSPPNIKIRLSKTLVVETDGLDNKAKAAKMKIANIPLFAIQSTNDDFMGRKRQGNAYTENFAEDLLVARYGKVETKNLMTICAEHSHPFFMASITELKKLKDFVLESKTKALTDSRA